MDYCLKVNAHPYAHFLLKEQEALESIKAQSSEIGQQLSTIPITCISKGERQDVLSDLDSAEDSIVRMDKKRGDLVLALTVASKVVEFALVFFTIGYIAMSLFERKKIDDQFLVRSLVGLTVLVVTQLISLYKQFVFREYVFQATKRLKSYKRVLYIQNNTIGKMLGEVDGAIVIHPSKYLKNRQMMVDTEKLLEKVHLQDQFVDRVSSSGSEGDVDEPLPPSCESSDTF